MYCYKEITVSCNLGLIFLALAIIPICDNTIVLIKLTAEIFCNVATSIKESDGTRNMSGEMVRQVVNKPPD